MVKIYKNGKDFYEENQSSILKNELINQFLYTNAIADKEADKADFFIKVYDRDKEFLLVHVAPYALCISGDIELLSEAVDVIIKQGYQINGVIAPYAYSHPFITEYCQKTNKEISVLNAMDIMVFQGTAKYHPNVIQCTEEHLEQLAEYRVAFMAEAMGDEVSKEDSLVALRKRMKYIYLYVLDGEVVSMASITRPTMNYQALSLAYTAPLHRSKGYIQSIMLHCCKVIEDDGKRPQLFVDKQNPISNHAYKKIGFEVYNDFYHYIIK